MKYAKIKERKVHIMNNLLPLRPEEKEYKKFYNEFSGTESGPVLFEDRIEISAFHDFVRQHAADPQKLFLPDLNYNKSLNENQYFDEQLDVAALQHLRYTPATIHTHEFFEIACVLSGTFTNYIGDSVLTLTAGDIFILSPNTSHAISAFSDDAILINILVRSSTFERHFLNLIPKNNLLYHFFSETLFSSSSAPYLIFRTGNDAEVTDYVTGILNESNHNNRYKNTMLSSMVSIFFVYLMRKHESDIIIPGIDSGNENTNSIFIIEYLQQNYTDLTLGELAAFFNYSERQMQRILKKMTELSFNEIIRKLRMEKAAELLADDSASIQSIADHLGFYDAQSFRKTFRAYYGMTPKEYRKTERTQL